MKRLGGIVFDGLELSGVGVKTIEIISDEREMRRLIEFESFAREGKQRTVEEVSGE